MSERKANPGQHFAMRAVGWVAAVLAGALGSVEVAEQWKMVQPAPSPASAIAQDHRSRTEINRDATVGTVQTLTGDVAQDFSRDVVLHNTAFRVEVVRATGDASAAKQQLRDEILDVLDGLVGAAGAHSLSHEQARALGQRLGTMLEEAPISPYQLQGREFTLGPGTAYFLPGGNDSFTYVGPAKDGAAHAISIRRNARESAMPVGGVRLRQVSESCRLLPNEVAEDFATATFS
jgi:hypothetical protein